jgi:hypothetical protein
MTIICCFAVLIAITAVGSKKVPQPGVRNAIKLLGGKGKLVNFDMTDRATLGLTYVRGARRPAAPHPFEDPGTLSVRDTFSVSFGVAVPLVPR